MPRALIIGGTGAIGFATAARLLAAGWRVDLLARDPAHVPHSLAAAGATFAAVDRDDGAGLAAAFGTGADLVVDCMCKTAAQATGLVPLLSATGAAVMISSKAVYVDARGRHANSIETPRFDGPICESQATMRPNGAPPASREGYGAHKVAAEEVLLDSGLPVTVLRPSLVHGAWSRRPREWIFVKRILDRRPRVLLARAGAGIDHPSAAANIAALIQTVAAAPGRRVLNIADPDTPTALEISRIVAAHLNHSWEEVLLQGTGPEGRLGRTPWDRVPPVVLDTAAARQLGYEPVGTYAQTVTEELDWLIASVRDPARSWALPGPHDPFFDGLFDYAGEDRYTALSGERGAGGLAEGFRGRPSAPAP